jgi:hypothetical protein
MNCETFCEKYPSTKVETAEGEQVLCGGCLGLFPCQTVEIIPGRTITVMRPPAPAGEDEVPEDG